MIRYIVWWRSSAPPYDLKTAWVSSSNLPGLLRELQESGCSEISVEVDRCPLYLSFIPASHVATLGSYSNCPVSHARNAAPQTLRKHGNWEIL